MKNLVLKIRYFNWGMRKIDSVNNIEWKIYDDCTVKVKIFSFEEPIKKDYKIEKKLYDDLIKNIELSKNNNEKIYALDGEAWEFIQFDNGKKIWKRDLGHIYGIETLGNIAANLMKLIDK